MEFHIYYIVHFILKSYVGDIILLFAVDGHNSVMKSLSKRQLAQRARREREQL